MIKDKKDPSEEGFLRRTLTGLFVKKDKEEDKPSDEDATTDTEQVTKDKEEDKPSDEDATTHTEQVTKDLTELAVQLALTN